MREASGAVANQPPLYGGINLFEADPLLNSCASGFPDAVRTSLADHGAFWGSHEARELARLADRHLPELERYDAQGRRIDQIAFHPAYHGLMRRSVAAGLQASGLHGPSDEAGLRHRARAARFYMTAQTECGHLCPMTMTQASLAALAAAPGLIAEWGPRIAALDYDASHAPAATKRGVTLGMGLTEKQGGTDLRAVASVAEPDGAGAFRITGHKWFLSAPMSDAFLVLARTAAGPSAFLMPRVLPDGTRNALRLERLKDKLGNRSNATAEAEFDGASASLVGDEGRGIQVLLDMITLTRLDCAVASAGLMRGGFAEALHHVRHRAAFGRKLVDAPLMVRVLSDMALDLAAALALSMRLAEAFDMAAAQPAQAAYARAMTAAAKYWICKSAPAFLYEAMECLGGNGYVETGTLARLYREAPVNAIWDGSGNVVALDVVRALRGDGVLELTLATIAEDLGPGSRTAVDVLAAAARVAAQDEGSARMLAEQLALTAAAAALRRDFPPAFAEAFTETRLGRPWRATYGMIDGRFDSRALLDYIAPPLG